MKRKALLLNVLIGVFAVLYTACSEIGIQTEKDVDYVYSVECTFTSDSAIGWEGYVFVTKKEHGNYMSYEIKGDLDGPNNTSSRINIDWDVWVMGSGEKHMYMGDEEEGSEETESSSYPFYVRLKSSDGLMLGQHVYIEPDAAGAAGAREGIWLDESYIVDADSDDPYVWAANRRGRIGKRSVRLGDYDEETMEYEITDGLAGEDQIAFPEESLKEGDRVK